MTSKSGEFTSYYPVRYVDEWIRHNAESVRLGLQQNVFLEFQQFLTYYQFQLRNYFFALEASVAALKPFYFVESDFTRLLNYERARKAYITV